ncbi:unnamed protein product [Caretta caretta]
MPRPPAQGQPYLCPGRHSPAHSMAGSEGGYSVVFLQETHTDLTAKDSWRLEWGDGVYFSHFTIRQAGVVTLFSPNLRPEVLGVTEAVPGHLLHLGVRMEGLVVNLVNIYAPTTSPKRPQFYQWVSDFLSTLDSHECLVLGGDFNTTLEEQETHTDPTAEDSWQLEWGDRVYFSHSTVQQAGVATLFSPDLRPEVLGVAEAMPGRLLHLRVCMEGLVVNLVNVYAPTSGPEQLQFYQWASAFLSTLDSHECLALGGDFNTTLEERDHSGTEQSLAAANTLQEIVEHHSLVDIWRDHHPDDTSTFTFVQVEAHRSCHSRLDRIYLSRFHLSRATLPAFGWPHFLTIT